VLAAPVLAILWMGLAPAEAVTSRIVSVADLHGDFDHALRVLQAAGLVEVPADSEVITAPTDPNGRPFSRYKGVTWVGGNTTLVQTGDIVDRGTFSRDLYALFAELRRQAPAVGGRVVNLIGNHEHLNVRGALQYAGKLEALEYGGLLQQRQAFKADGWIGRQVAQEFQAAVVVDGTVFVHAGILPDFAVGGVDKLNDMVRSSLYVPSERNVFGQQGPFWLRRYAMGNEVQACPLLARTLELLHAQRMVVGHTAQDDGVIRTRCDGQLVLADTFMSKSGYGECWQKNSMLIEGCQGSLNFVEFLDGSAQAVRVAGVELITTPLPLRTVSSDHVDEL